LHGPGHEELLQTAEVGAQREAHLRAATAWGEAELADRPCRAGDDLERIASTGLVAGDLDVRRDPTTPQAVHDLLDSRPDSDRTLRGDLLDVGPPATVVRRVGE